MHFGSQTDVNRFPFEAHHRVPSSGPYNQILFIQRLLSETFRIIQHSGGAGRVLFIYG